MNSLPKTPVAIRDAAQADFLKRLRNTGKFCLISRLNDTSDVRAGGRGKARGHLQAQPADYLVEEEDHHLYLAEVKGTTNVEKFNFDNFESFQKAWMRQTAEYGHDSYYVFLRSFATNEWFKIPATVAAKFLGRSIKFTELREYLWII